MSNQAPDAAAIAAPLLRYLRAAFANDRIDYAEPPHPLAGGFDTNTYGLSLVGAGDVVPPRLVLRHFRGFGNADRAPFEFAVQNALAEVGVPAAHPYLLCTDVGVLDGAFFLMAELPGIRLIDLPEDQSSVAMGRAHAALHDVDPAPVAAALTEAAATDWTLDDRFAAMRRAVDRHPWSAAAVDWFEANRPADPPQLALCHNDFHKLNVLVDNDEVSGIVDWTGFLVADPALDVASTLVIFSIAAKHHIAAGLTPPVDLDQVVLDYLAAYEAERELDRARLGYYRAWRCLASLQRAAEGNAPWHVAGMTEEMTALVRQVTGLTLEVPPGL